ncbi:hypothetical protein AURDEDRAFT_185457 [Auricularia subglabra TFB-10046 SS5]|nr:hypothetical protein AURDEDRAFT_185457 [Auricularia subglabra TFB-10046 SS5]
MFSIPAARRKALEDAVEQICEDAMLAFDTRERQSGATAQRDLEQSIWSVVKRVCGRFARLQNARTPALRTPEEVLVMVFSCLNTPALVHASHVCQTWRDVALLHASLWANLDARTFKPAGLYHLLNRSQALPLHLEILIVPSNALDLAYNTSNHMIRLVHLTIHIDDPETRSPRESSDNTRHFASIPAVLINPAPILRRLTVRDPHRTMRMIGTALFDQQVPALRFLDYHGDVSLYPFMAELSNITHFSHAPVFLGQLQLDSLVNILGMCQNLEHFSLHIPANYTFPALDQVHTLPESIKHFELHVHAEDADVAHFLPFFAVPRPLFAIALHAEPYNASGFQRFLTSVLQSRDITALHMEKSPLGLITIASADDAGFQTFFCDFPRGCPPPDSFFAHITSMSIGDTFWTLSPPPPLPQLTALELHMSPPPERYWGVLMQPPARSGLSLLLCPLLRTLVLVCDQSAGDEVTERSIASSLVLAFIQTRLAFDVARLRRLVLNRVLLQGDSAALSGVVDEIVDERTPWTWAGALMAGGHGAEQCSLPLRAGVFRGHAAQSISDWW